MNNTLAAGAWCWHDANYAGQGDALDGLRQSVRLWRRLASRPP